VRLFVYGSLKSGMRHHTELSGVPRLGHARTSAGYSLVLAGAYPALVRLPSETGVAGELYDVHAEHLARLDDFEECPRRYQREAIALSDGSFAHAYVMQPGAVADCAIIAGGVWREPADAVLNSGFDQE
jgi:gamma-glutamylaminecyclotransferase